MLRCVSIKYLKCFLPINSVVVASSWYFVGRSNNTLICSKIDFKSNNIAWMYQQMPKNSEVTVQMMAQITHEPINCIRNVSVYPAIVVSSYGILSG